MHKSRWIPVAAIGLGTAATAFGYHRARTWGSTAAERSAALPGDEIVDPCQLQADRCITIDAPASAVWPWLAQLGQDRAGFYSYERLENLIGCEIQGETQLRAEWATREVGDAVHLAPDMSLRAHLVSPGEYLVLVGDPAYPTDSALAAETDQTPPPGMPQSFTWAFVLTDLGQQTRLHVRERYQVSNTLEAALYKVVILTSFIMTQKMLHSIKNLAQNTSANSIYSATNQVDISKMS